MRSTASHGPLQAVGVLFAEIVPMQAADAVELIHPEIGPPDAQPGTRGAGVIDGDRAFRVLGIDPQAEFQLPACCLGSLFGQVRGTAATGQRN